MSTAHSPSLTRSRTSSITGLGFDHEFAAMHARMEAGTSCHRGIGPDLGVDVSSAAGTSAGSNFSGTAPLELAPSKSISRKPDPAAIDAARCRGPTNARFLTSYFAPAGTRVYES